MKRKRLSEDEITTLVDRLTTLDSVSVDLWRSAMLELEDVQDFDLLRVMRRVQHEEEPSRQHSAATREAIRTLIDLRVAERSIRASRILTLWLVLATLGAAALVRFL